jgi:hypothetical protein
MYELHFSPSAERYFKKLRDKPLPCPPGAAIHVYP